MELPDWLSRTEKGVMEIDPDIAYPAIAAELKKKGVPVDAENLDQYWVETLYQCAKMEVQRIVGGTEFDPRPEKSLVIHILADGERKTRWALANLPEGRGAEAASQGREAKEHYRRWRGFVPD